MRSALNSGAKLYEIEKNISEFHAILTDVCQNACQREEKTANHWTTYETMISALPMLIRLGKAGEKRKRYGIDIR